MNGRMCEESLYLHDFFFLILTYLQSFIQRIFQRGPLNGSQLAKMIKSIPDTDVPAMKFIGMKQFGLKSCKYSFKNYDMSLP